MITHREYDVLEHLLKESVRVGDLVAERKFTKMLFEAYGINWNKNISNLDEVIR